MRIPVNLLVFLALAGAFYLIILPKKAAFTKGLMQSMGKGPISREDSTKLMVEARIIVDVCPRADLSEYRAVSWSDYYAESDADASITHDFTCDGSNRKFLFRLHYGTITEIVDLR